MRFPRLVTLVRSVMLVFLATAACAAVQFAPSTAGWRMAEINQRIRDAALARAARP